eukprot:3346134-Ditylum_brightwellii.AAC.1
MLNERIASKANSIVSINSTRRIPDTTASVKSGLVKIQDDVTMTARRQEKQQQRQSNLDILDDRIARKSFKEGEEKNEENENISSSFPTELPLLQRQPPTGELPQLQQQHPTTVDDGALFPLT